MVILSISLILLGVTTLISCQLHGLHSERISELSKEVAELKESMVIICISDDE